jgi:hypothetical protein
MLRFLGGEGGRFCGGLLAAFPDGVLLFDQFDWNVSERRVVTEQEYLKLEQ